MSVADLSFTVSSSPVTDPLTVGSTAVTLTVTNNGTSSVVGAGFYISPSTFTGPYTSPPSGAPEGDYQDMVIWGTASHLTGPTTGGLLIVSFTGPSGVQSNKYVRSTFGDNFANRIVLEDLAAGAATAVEMKIETPSGVTARNVYFDFRVE